MLPLSKTMTAVLIGSLVLGLGAGTAIAVDQLQLREQAQDQLCVQTPGSDCDPAATCEVVQNRERVAESEDATGAVRTRTEAQIGEHEGCECECDGECTCECDCACGCDPASEGAEPEANTLRIQDRDRVSEGVDPSDATRTRTEEQVREQADDPVSAGPGPEQTGPCSEDSGQTQTRARQSGPGGDDL